MSLATDKPQATPILEDASDNTGKPLSYKAEGSAAASGGTNYAAMMVGKDGSGNLQFISLNANREVVVSTESANLACLNGSAKVVGGTTEQTVFDINLVAGREYREIGWIVSNFRQSEYRILHVDDPGGTPVEEELATILVGPGDYTDSGELHCLNFTAGATTPVLRLVGTNKDVASDLRGTLSTQEVQ